MAQPFVTSAIPAAPVIYQQPAAAFGAIPQQPTVVLRPAAPPPKAHGMPAYEWVLIILVIIILIGVIVWIIWFFGVRNTGQTVGGSCAQNSDCEIGTYCSASRICAAGEGRDPGEPCLITSECKVGLRCQLEQNGTSAFGLCIPAINPLV